MGGGVGGSDGGGGKCKKRKKNTRLIKVILSRHIPILAKIVEGIGFSLTYTALAMNCKNGS